MQTYEINLWKDKVIVEKIIKQFESDDKVLDYIANFDTSPTPNYPSLDPLATCQEVGWMVVNNAEKIVTGKHITRS